MGSGSKSALEVVRFFDHRLYINHGRTVDRFDRADQETTLIDRQNLCAMKAQWIRAIRRSSQEYSCQRTRYIASRMPFRASRPAR